MKVGTTHSVYCIAVISQHHLLKHVCSSASSSWWFRRAQRSSDLFWKLHHLQEFWRSTWYSLSYPTAQGRTVIINTQIEMAIHLCFITSCVQDINIWHRYRYSEVDQQLFLLFRWSLLFIHAYSFLFFVYLPSFSLTLIPQNDLDDPERGMIFVCSATHKTKSMFFFLAQTEQGDIFKVTLETDEEMVSRRILFS